MSTDLLTGLAAGLWVSLFSNLFALKSRTGFAMARFTLLAVLSYVAVAALLNCVWRSNLRRMVPNFILIAVAGSLLLVCIKLVPGVIGGWYDPYRLESSLYDYLAHELQAARSVVIVFSLVALPVSAITYYAGSMFEAARRWHSGTDESISIVCK
ncbi:MAG TPA: hypothetical protein VF527_20150 [Pyrinomonadaceae bacterium]